MKPDNYERLRKIGLVLLGVTSLALLVFVTFFSKSTQQEKEIQSPPQEKSDQSETSGEAVTSQIPQLNIETVEAPEWRQSSTTATFSIDESFLESKLMVYQKTADGLVLNDVEAKRLAAEFGFGNIPQESISDQGKVWTWLRGGDSLSINLNKRTLEYFLDSLNDPDIVAPGVEVIETEALGIAKNFLTQKGLMNDYIDTQNPKISYSETYSLETEKPSLVKKEIAGIEFPLKIADKPLLVSKSLSSKVKVGVSSRKVVISLKMPLYSSIWGELGEAPLISLDEAKNTVSGGGGVMVQNSFFGGASSVLQSFDLSSVYLAYYGENYQDQYLQPVYVFEGTGILEDDTESKVVVYVPAVRY
ncbi:MAG: hypothetical protein A3F33_02325 [Candidatus Woykebacteria bacterium RIFCSPHIGHO2_12_FULL_43_10]|uniref:Uncharacterized protein n=1 Tax=Candidatus Woykebacteria bacterium RIFCSPHIGHO2_02_FULL_43_16b TaxID=1802601 RepID=A0A1G1WL40_9BACT|nr:MAG: hypothetical protein A3J50_00380 [Candidatus Woykebacteria bacterium RIFCSPHIGHO2_02_FULL_43_16b]OGY28812.1 MAG: hypothetical protein A3F33_02325 [Candidatus Woykebacteria bacterium RIFCSPHIGHO2_12_FULL_43_10]